MVQQPEQAVIPSDAGPVIMAGAASSGGVRTEAPRAYRVLGYGERAVRRCCPGCHDRHAALINWRTWTLQCRACGHVFDCPFLFGSKERRRRTSSDPVRQVVHGEGRFGWQEVT